MRLSQIVITYTPGFTTQAIARTAELGDPATGLPQGEHQSEQIVFERKRIHVATKHPYPVPYAQLARALERALDHSLA